jgi:Cd2+/Zn2+-exporting ATPase
MELNGIAYAVSESVGTKVYVAEDGRFAGSLTIRDEIRPDSRAAVSGLRARGIRRILMLTGDDPKAALLVGEELGIHEVHAGLLPDEKVDILEQTMQASEQGGKRRGRILVVGDGINDAPMLARADVGIAMGGLGSDAAIEAADIVVMNDQPSRIITAMDIAKKTKTVVWQNIVFSLVVKFLVLEHAAMGLANRWEAVFADVGVALLATLNALRAGRVKDRR